MTRPLPIWLRGTRLQREVADVTDHWLRQFKIAHPGDVRKEGGAERSGRLIYRVSAVLAELDREANGKQGENHE